MPSSLRKQDGAVVTLLEGGGAGVQGLETAAGAGRVVGQHLPGSGRQFVRGLNAVALAQYAVEAQPDVAGASCWPAAT